MNQSINKVVSQSIKQAINQSIYPSINRHTYLCMNQCSLVHQSTFHNWIDNIDLMCQNISCRFLWLVARSRMSHRNDGSVHDQQSTNQPITEFFIQIANNHSTTPCHWETHHSTNQSTNRPTDQSVDWLINLLILIGLQLGFCQLLFVYSISAPCWSSIYQSFRNQSISLSMCQLFNQQSVILSISFSTKLMQFLSNLPLLKWLFS